MEPCGLCYCILPWHVSALVSTLSSTSKGCCWGRLLIEVALGAAANSSSSIIRSEDENPLYRQRHHHHYDVLILQCHSDGVLWNGLLPLLFPRAMVGNSLSQSITTAAADSSRNNTSEQIVHTRQFGFQNADQQHSNGSGKRNNTRRRWKRSLRNNDTRVRAFSVLTRHFRNHIRRICVNVDVVDDDCSNDVTSTKERSDCVLIERIHYSTNSSSSSSSNISTIIIILPPNSPLLNNEQQRHQSDDCSYNYYSRTSSTSPTNPWTLRLLTNEKNIIRLTSLSAYISTLGGGFFLCRHLSTAITLARRQCAIALLRGDGMMALKCRINEGYCYIHGGKLNKGKKVIKRVLRDVIQLQLEEQGGVVVLMSEEKKEEEEESLFHHPSPNVELSEILIVKNMCHSALRFADLIREASSSLTATVLADDERSSSSDSGLLSLPSKNDYDHDQDAGCVDTSLQSKMDVSGRQHDKMKIISPTHDDYQRIRVVQDRKWRCVE